LRHACWVRGTAGKLRTQNKEEELDFARELEVWLVCGVSEAAREI